MDWTDFLAQCIPEPRTITVEAYTGSGAYGDVFAAPAQVMGCVIEETRRLVPVQTQDAAGATTLSSTTVYGPASMATAAPVGSRVALPSGRVTRVLSTSLQDAHGWDLPEHTELALE
jgi:hypothetical protein